MAGGLSSAAPTPIGFAAPAAAVVRTGQPAECWTITADDVDAWLTTALPGESLIYAHGPQLVQGGAAGRVNTLTKSGDVTPHHRRTADGGFDFIVRRCAPRPITAEPVCSPPMMAVLVELQAVAMKGARCPSDSSLGARTGMTADQVKWQLKKLKEARFISCRTIATRADPRFRVVTIVATGQSTAGPQP